MMKKMEATIPSEPGVTATFRRFISGRLVLFLFAVVIYQSGVGWYYLDNWLPFVLMLLEGILLLVYLSLPRLRLSLKSAYLPVGIIWATLGPLTQMHVFFSLFAGATPERPAFLLILQSILVLFIPLVITAWQYSLRAVFLFCGLTFLFDGFMAYITFQALRHDLSSFLIFPLMMGMAFTRTFFFLYLGIMIANLVKVQREQHRRLREANERLAQYAATVEQLTISRERNRVARELHDVLAHTMSGVAVELEGVRAMLPVNTDQARALLDQSLGAVRAGLSETRRALQALRASPLEDLGLGLSIRNLTESIAGRAGLQSDMNIAQDIPDYPLHVQQSFYRVAQEALANVVSHARARRVQVWLLREGQGIKLWIRDDGIGFDEATVDLHQKYGLLGIREWAAMINGQLSITSQVGNGTEIILRYEAAPKEVSIG